MARSGIKINKRAVAKASRDLEREFAKHPVRIPVEVDESVDHGVAGPPTTVYNGPVFYGSADGAQLAWNNETVHQSQRHTEKIAAGFEMLAQGVVDTLQGLRDVGLDEDDVHAAEAAGEQVLREVTKPEPDRSIIRGGVTVLKGLLAPIALGIKAGARDGAQEWARTTVEQLASSI